MGVVYEAEDLKMGRHVALKFLPDDVAQDTHRLSAAFSRTRNLRVTDGSNAGSTSPQHEIDIL